MQEEMKIVEQFLKECEEEILKALESGELQTFMSQEEALSLEAKSLEGISLPTDIPQFREIKSAPANRFRKK